MGLFGWFATTAAVAKGGEIKNLKCNVCGDEYRFNISPDFPHQICGRCLEKAFEKAKANGDYENMVRIELEFKRRNHLPRRML